MTSGGERSVSSGGRRTNSSTVRYVIALGWILLAIFALASALLGSIGADVRAFQAAYSAGFIGYALLLWVVLRRGHADNLGGWGWWLTGCIVLRVCLLAAQPSDDAYRYVWEGRIQLAGFNPYTHAPDDPQLLGLRNRNWEMINHPDYPAIYGPIAQLEFLAAAAVHPSTYLIKTFHVLWDVVAVAVLAGCLRQTGRRPHAAIVYALCPLVLSAFAIEGHVDSLMLAFTTLAVWALITKRNRLAGAMLGMAIATKIVALVLLPCFLFRHRRAAVTAVITVLVCYIPYVFAGGGVFTSLLRFSSADEHFSMLGTLSVTSFDSPAARGAVLMALGCILLVLPLWRRQVTAYGAAAMGALVILMPVVHYWYLTWVLVFLPFGLRIRWLVAAAAMVVCFEAELHRQTGGAWRMPGWAPLVVWIAFLGAWVAESAQARLAKRTTLCVDARQTLN